MDKYIHIYQYIYIYIYIWILLVIEQTPLKNMKVNWDDYDEYAPWCWYMYLQNWVIFRANVGIHIPYMEHLGMEKM